MCDAPTAAAWIGDVLEVSVASMEAPLFLRLAHAWANDEPEAVARWNAEFIATRETAELRAETLQMGYSLRNLLRDPEVGDGARLEALEELAFPTAFTFAVASWAIDAREALSAYLFAWIENQVLAALKSVPLGQTEGQRLLRDVASTIPAIVERAAGVGDNELTNFAPGLAMACSRHETQYSRIFRS